MLRISEIFLSIQGEGRFAGTPSVFVRTTGCNLRCWFCDTPYTSWKPEGAQRPWRSVFDEVLQHDVQHVVLTGGEPLLQPDIVALSGALHDAGKYVTIETAGTIFRPITVDLVSLSPKLSNSVPLTPSKWRDRHSRAQENDAVVRRLIAGPEHQIKFVVDERADLVEIAAYLERFPEVAPDSVWLMPQGITVEELAARSAWLTPWAYERGYHVSPRRHIELYGYRRGV